MILKIADDNKYIIKNGVYLYSLVNYPKIQSWEWNNILAFICYEKSQCEKFEIVCENKDILSLVQDAANKLDGTEYIPPAAEAIEEFVYHATNVFAAQKILSSGRLLSATRAYRKTREELAIERRACGWEDPPHFYEYVMFGWGTHLVGDYVVLSEDFPCEEDFLKGNFDAGVRFYIRYEDIIKHKDHTFDGYHAIKVKDEVLLSDYLFACIVPEQYKQQLENSILQEFINRMHYLPQRGLSLQDWNNSVIEYIRML
ncbi:MAG: hypothetical protein HDR72_00530 [Ruminococcaceae bacterium]|nr:hypothetical protein [Oscillospiraceae bacterium]